MFLPFNTDMPVSHADAHHRVQCVTTASQRRGDTSAQNQAPSHTSWATKRTCEPSARSSKGESADLDRRGQQAPDTGRALAACRQAGHRSTLWHSSSGGSGYRYYNNSTMMKKDLISQSPPFLFISFTNLPFLGLTYSPETPANGARSPSLSPNGEATAIRPALQEHHWPAQETPKRGVCSSCSVLQGLYKPMH